MNEVEEIEGERMNLKLVLTEGWRERGGGVWRIEAVASLEATHARRNDAWVGPQTPSIEGSSKMRNNIHRAQAPNNIQKLKWNKERLQQPKQENNRISQIEKDSLSRQNQGGELFAA